MKHSFAATNPCHVYEMALSLWQRDALGGYYSGYPRWRLKPPAGFPVRVSAGRTIITYSMQRLPEWLRIRDDRMFRWQDSGFDRAISSKLSGEGFVHGLPGQCMHLFEQAKQLGMVTVLNHASGPLHKQRQLIAPEYERVGISLEELVPLPDDYKTRLSKELDLAQVHCVASTVVRDQLIEDGIEEEKIWVVPYGADSSLFRKRSRSPGGNFKICFAGRQSLRKGIHYLLKALEITDSCDWELHCFGMQFEETAHDFENYKGGSKIIQRGSVSQAELGKAFHEMDVLVLPSAEEAFGLVVVQALEAGIPCIVSDRVGAKDLIREGETGSIVAFGDIEAYAKSLMSWDSRRTTVQDHFPWSNCAENLLLQAGQFPTN